MTGKEGGPQSVLPPTPKKLAMDDVALEEQDVNFEGLLLGGYFSQEAAEVARDAAASAL